MSGNQCTSSAIYELLWATFEPHTRKMSPEQMAEFDGLVDLAARKLVALEPEIAGAKR